MHWSNYLLQSAKAKSGRRLHLTVSRPGTTFSARPRPHMRSITVDPTAYQIIDCHIHPAVDELTETNWFTSTGSVQDQIDVLRRAGIVQACGSPITRLDPDSFDDVKQLNDRALRLRDHVPDFYIPGIQVHPRFPEESCAEIDRCCGTEGVRWIGELVGYMTGYGVEYATPEALTIMRHAGTHGAVVNIHCHDLDVVDALCTAVPDLPIVLAHPSCDRTEFLARIEKVASHPNLHLDISGSGIDRFGLIRKAIDTAGADRLLFGTDYPINNPAVYTYGALLEPLSEPERHALFRGNFLRLIGSNQST